METAFIGAGFLQLVIGSLAFFLPHKRMVRWAIESREKLMERYMTRGDEKMVLGLSREIAAVEATSPLYSKICIGIGALLLATALLF